MSCHSLPAFRQVIEHACIVVFVACLRIAKEPIVFRCQKRERISCRAPHAILVCYNRQGWVWNTYGPIAITTLNSTVFNWNDAIVAWMALWGPVGYFIAFAPTAWMLDVLQMRPTAITAAALVLAGCLVRMISTDNVPLHNGTNVTLTMVVQHVGQMLNGLAGPFSMSAGTVLSAAWFAPKERTISTAIFCTANQVCSSIWHVVGSLCLFCTNMCNTMHVRLWAQPSSCGSLTFCFMGRREGWGYDQLHCWSTTGSCAWNGRRRALLPLGLRWCSSTDVCASSGILAIEATSRCIVFLRFSLRRMVRDFLTRHCRTPACMIMAAGFEPSSSAAVERIPIREGVGLLLHNRNFWLVTIAYAFCTGFYAGWGPLYALIVNWLGPSIAPDPQVRFHGTDLIVVCTMPKPSR